MHRVLWFGVLLTSSLLPGMTLAGVVAEPPKVAKVSGYPDNDDAVLKLLPKPVAPKDFDDAIDALQRGALTDRIAVLKAKAKSDLVAFGSGNFMMGDFGQLWNPSGLYYYDFKDDKPVHQVTLSAFAIQKYKVTFAEYDVFAQATKHPLLATSEDDRDMFRHPTVPVRAAWADARDYCVWLGGQIGRNMTVPTEAQWEYAARSGGKYFAVATDDGNIDFGRNIPFSYYRSYLMPEGREYFVGFSAGYYPPNPAGIFQMHINGEEWVLDWYDEAYYKKSPQNNPTGPKRGEFKALRGQPSTGAGELGFVFARKFAPPNKATAIKDGQRALDKQDAYSAPYRNTWRCAAKS